ncbi:MAG: metallophosphoesterase [Clostridia bacterium]|nr:metallophosphoesterase [Clostridia bacterium]
MKNNEKNCGYELICAMEEASLNKRFLPYCVGNPKRTLTFNDQFMRANFVFFTDSHIDLFNPDECVDNVHRTIEYANNSPIKFDAVLHAGDIITPWNMVPKDNALARAKSFFDIAKQSSRPFVFSIGNHDSNDSENIPENAFTGDDWGKLFLDYAEEKYGIVRQKKADGTRSTWHYLDIDEKKIRIISLDSLDTDRSVTDENGKVKFFSKYGSFFSNEQLSWLANTALDFDGKEDDGWGVIFVFHMFPEDFGFHQDSGKVLMGIASAFNDSSTYSYSFKHSENPFFDMDIKADFTRYTEKEKKPHVICMLLGHDHEDKNTIRDGINIIWSLNGSSSEQYGDARVVRIPGTCTQNSFDVLNIDTLNRKIRMFRYGAGLNCYGDGGDRFLPDGLDY